MVTGKRLAERVEAAARELGQVDEPVKVTDLVEITDLGFRIPALVVNGRLQGDDMYRHFRSEENARQSIGKGGEK